MPDKPNDKPLLQGWAVVDNTIGEDWQDVELTLVAGAPQSFVQNISQPYYVRRPGVALPESAQLTPQTHEAAFDRLEQYAKLQPGVVGAGSPGVMTGLQGFVRDSSGAVIPNARVTVRNEETGSSQNTTTNSQGMYRFDNIPAGNSALFVDAPGFRRFQLTSFYLGTDRMNEIDARLEVGSTSEAVTVSASTPTVETQSTTLSSARSYAEGEEPQAEAQGLGDNFEYKLKQKITIGKNQSALVPILQSKIEAEKVTLWTAGTENVLRALWIKNTSGLTLDGGSFNLIDSDAFAGEGMLETVHPDERRLISYAADPAVRVVDRMQQEEKPVSRVRMTKGVLIATQELRSTHKFVIRNSDTAPRQVVVEYPVRSGWKLVDTLKPVETTANFYRLRVPVDAGKSGELLVEEYSPQDTRYELAGLEGRTGQASDLARCRQPHHSLAQGRDPASPAKESRDRPDRGASNRPQAANGCHRKRSRTLTRKYEGIEREHGRTRFNSALHPRTRLPGRQTSRPAKGKRGSRCQGGPNQAGSGKHGQSGSPRRTFLRPSSLVGGVRAGAR
jgi:hypothetical protein